MAGYKAVYKCRLCGKLFSMNKIYTEDKAIERMAEVNTIPVVSPSSRGRGIHLCVDESYGFADLQGFRKVQSSL